MQAPKINKSSDGAKPNNHLIRKPLVQKKDVKTPGVNATAHTSILGRKVIFGSKGSQAKLKVGSPNDKFEKEADSVAEKVVSSSPQPKIQKKPAPPIQTMKVNSGDLQKTSEPKESIQKLPEEKALESELEVQTKPLHIQKMEMASEEDESVQMKPDDALEVQSKADNTDANSYPDISAILQSSKGSGQSLDVQTKSEMESGFGHDFSDVKVHTDSRATQMNQNLGAKAFTNGSDIYINRGEYQPESQGGKKLLAHELTHTIQQGAVSSGTPEVQRETEDSQLASFEESIEISFEFNGEIRTISVVGKNLTISSFAPEEAEIFNPKGGLQEGNPDVIYKGEQMTFKTMLVRIMKPEPGESFEADFVKTDGSPSLHVTYTKTIPAASSAEAPEQNSNASPSEAEVPKSSTSEVAEKSIGPYWKHEWHVDRFGNETVFIWEVGGKRRYSNADIGYAYLQSMALKTPGDADYDPRFERFKHRPQAGEGASTALNWWFKKTPGWDDPNHDDNGTADFQDLAEFKDAAHNKKFTGFYYMGYVFDPLIYEKLAEQKKNKANQKFIGTTVNYKAYVGAESGIILHDTPDPEDKSYQSKRNSKNKEDYIIEFNRPIKIIAEGNEEYEGWVMVENSIGEVGWIEKRFTRKKPEIKTNQIFDTYTVKPGDNLEGLIDSYYKTYPFATGNDRRTVALAIYLYNKDKPGSGVYRNYDKYKNAGSWKDYVDPWMQETRANYQSVELYAGADVILPPASYIQEMRRLGELEKRPDFVNVMIEGGRVLQGFLAGVGIGFWDAIIDTGTDLYDMIIDIFTGEIFTQMADMFNLLWEKGLSGIWDMIKDFGTSTWEELQAAWNNPNPYQRGEYFGKIIGAILFEVVLALLTAGIGSVVRNSARVQKVLKFFPKLNSKKLVPNNVDHYADDIKKMNKDRDLDLNKDKTPDRDKKTDQDKDRDNDSDREKDTEEDKAQDAKALLAAKAYVEIQDALDPSPEVRFVLAHINKMPAMKLSGGKRYKAEPNGLGEGHYRIYYNPPVEKDYTSGKTKTRLEKLKKSITKIIEDAKNGIIRKKTDYHGRLDNSKELEILSSPDAVYKSTGKGERLIFRKGDDVVILDGKGATKGQVVTSYGPSGPRGESGKAIFGGSATDPGMPITHEDIISGNVPSPGGNNLAPAELIDL